MIALESRKKLFEMLRAGCSSDFAVYLRGYEMLHPRPSKESFEVSCELVNGKRVDQMRLAVLGLQKHDVLEWLKACQRHIPMVKELLFDSALDACFGIGLADYTSGQGACRIKIYHNTFGNTYPQVAKFQHLRRLFALLGIPELEFIKDWQRFKKVDISGIDWDGQDQATIKVYYGPFYPQDLFGRFSEVFSKQDIMRYDALWQEGLLAEAFLFCAKYGRQGRSIRTDMRYRTKNPAAYLKEFDPHHEASRAFLDFYKVFPASRLEFISMEWSAVERMQFYFLLMNEPCEV